MYLGKRTQKEQSDKSSGEESDTEEALCHADKSKIMTWPVSIICTTEEEMLQEKLGYKKVYPWVQCGS